MRNDYSSIWRTSSTVHQGINESRLTTRRRPSRSMRRANGYHQDKRQISNPIEATQSMEASPTTHPDHQRSNSHKSHESLDRRHRPQRPEATLNRLHMEPIQIRKNLLKTTRTDHKHRQGKPQRSPKVPRTNHLPKTSHDRSKTKDRTSKEYTPTSKTVESKKPKKRTTIKEEEEQVKEHQPVTTREHI